MEELAEDLLRQTQSLSPTCRRGEGFASWLDVDPDAGVIRGQAVPFGKVVKLSSGLFEEFKPGAFSRQSPDPVGRVLLCYRHEEPIGRVTRLEETDGGLQFEARISRRKGIPEAERALALLADDLVDEVSVGFQAVADGMDVTQRDDGSTVVTHRRARLLEISLVPWGAYGRDAKLERSLLVDPQELARMTELQLRRAEKRAQVAAFVARVRS